MYFLGGISPPQLHLRNSQGGGKSAFHDLEVVKGRRACNTEVVQQWNEGITGCRAPLTAPAEYRNGRSDHVVAVEEQAGGKKAEHIVGPRPQRRILRENIPRWRREG